MKVRLSGNEHNIKVRRKTLLISDMDHFCRRFPIGIIVNCTGLLLETAGRLTDHMPPRELLQQVRTVALNIQGVSGVEKCHARIPDLVLGEDLVHLLSYLLASARL